MENKELKMKLDNFKRKNITLHEVILGGAAKISTIFLKQCNMSSMNPDMANFLSTSFLMFHIKFDEISTKLSI